MTMMETRHAHHEHIVALQVARLLDVGFRALPLPNLAYQVADGLYLYKIGCGFLDVVVIRAHDATVAARLINKFDPRHPIPTFTATSLDSAPGVIWYGHGRTQPVLDALFQSLYPSADHAQSLDVGTELARR